MPAVEIGDLTLALMDGHVQTLLPQDLGLHMEDLVGVASASVILEALVAPVVAPDGWVNRGFCEGPAKVEGACEGVFICYLANVDAGMLGELLDNARLGLEVWIEGASMEGQKMFDLDAEC